MIFASLVDELCKIAAARERVVQRVAYHFDPNAGADKWDKLVRNSQSLAFVKAITKHPAADKVLVAYLDGLHQLHKGQTVDKIPSFTAPGKTYEIRKMKRKRLGCTCNDWRFKGSMNPGYECKHIKAFLAKVQN